MKPIQCLLLLAIVFLLFSCKDYTAKSSEEMIMNSAVVTQSKLLTHTVADGQRLTKEALMSYLPISIGDMKKSGEIQFDRSADKHTEGIYHSVSQDYSNGNESLSIQV
ncbi:hypothetical protein OOZ15_03180 [Galbibacter sp. EGI 63066]|uniref:hypothetical protein n=1 Tax=Galbibacter sp. EGI 63066 TaxID=2993559 RepID=UPI002248D7E6|nr:hypothetical protein [Galbibacter sp. EGI 63066]MCX2678933.1 hypothetical protein [Galbibacter sp. EGI 63066]